MRGARSSRFQDGNLPAAQQAAAHHACSASARRRRPGENRMCYALPAGAPLGERNEGPHPHLRRAPAAVHLCGHPGRGAGQARVARQDSERMRTASWTWPLRAARRSRRPAPSSSLTGRTTRRRRGSSSIPAEAWILRRPHRRHAGGLFLHAGVPPDFLRVADVVIPTVSWARAWEARCFGRLLLGI